MLDTVSDTAEASPTGLDSDGLFPNTRPVDWNDAELLAGALAASADAAMTAERSPEGSAPRRVFATLPFFKMRKVGMLQFHH